MLPSSRTPEGNPNRCPICGHRFRIEPSWPFDDAPCPFCGHLLRFPSKSARGNHAQHGGIKPYVGAARGSDEPAFYLPLWLRVCQRIVPALARRTLASKRTHAEVRLKELLKAVRESSSRAELEALLGTPQYAFSRIAGSRKVVVEGYVKDGCRIELNFFDGRHLATIGFAEVAPYLESDLSEHIQLEDGTAVLTQ